MSHKNIENAIAEMSDELKSVDNDLIMDVAGVSQAIDHLRKALNKVEGCLDKRQFEEASSLGYSDVSSEFIFLQRTLGGLQHSYGQKQALVSEIALKSGVGVYEEVEPFVDAVLDSSKVLTKEQKMENEKIIRERLKKWKNSNNLK